MKELTLGEVLTLFGAVVATAWAGLTFIAKLFMTRVLSQVDKLVEKVDAVEQSQQGSYSVFATKDEVRRLEDKHDDRIQHIERNQPRTR